MAEAQAPRDLAVVIMAAGKGTRMKDPDMAKVMFPIEGKPMVAYVVDLAERLGAARILLGLGRTHVPVRREASAIRHAPLGGRVLRVVAWAHAEVRCDGAGGPGQARPRPCRGGPRRFPGSGSRCWNLNPSAAGPNPRSGT